MQYTIKVDSSLIDNAVWDIHSKNITVTFKNGHQYTYPDFTYDEYKEFATASSKGKWFGKNLKNREYIDRIKPADEQ